MLLLAATSTSRSFGLTILPISKARAFVIKKQHAPCLHIRASTQQNPSYHLNDALLPIPFRIGLSFQVIWVDHASLLEIAIQSRVRGGLSIAKHDASALLDRCLSKVLDLLRVFWMISRTVLLLRNERNPTCSHVPIRFRDLVLCSDSSALYNIRILPFTNFLTFLVQSNCNVCILHTSFDIITYLKSNMGTFARNLYLWTP